MELYFVFSGSFSTIKNNRFPSADTVGLNSARGVLMFGPKFSILMIVDAVIIFSFWGIKSPVVSAEGWDTGYWLLVTGLNSCWDCLLVLQIKQLYNTDF